jgi:hypothetical protein
VFARGKRLNIKIQRHKINPYAIFMLIQTSLEYILLIIRPLINKGTNAISEKWDENSRDIKNCNDIVSCCGSAYCHIGCSVLLLNQS